VKDYKRLGKLGIVNPPLRDETHVKFLRENLSSVDVLASDHAPHTLEEKEEGASGLPGIETMIPLMMRLVKRGEIPLLTLLRIGCESPAKIFGIEKRGRIEKGFYADIVVFEKKERRIEAKNLHSKCGWTPYEGFPAVHPRVVMRRGEVIFDEGILASKGSGREI
jgi:dihydroorotase